MKAKNSNRGVTPEDKALGEQIRARRILAKVSQAELGDALGVSFQQIQKYEKGVNRVTYRRLEAIATKLGESMSYFQSGGAVSKTGAEMQTLMADPLNLRMARAFAKIKDKSLRFQFAHLIESVGPHA